MAKPFRVMKVRVPAFCERRASTCDLENENEKRGVRLWAEMGEKGNAPG